MKRLIAWAATGIWLLALGLLMAAQGNAGEYQIEVGDTCWYGSGVYVLKLDSTCYMMMGQIGGDDECLEWGYEWEWERIVTGAATWEGDDSVDSATTMRALDSMFEIPGIWHDNDNVDGNVGLQDSSYAGPWDSIQPAGQYVDDGWYEPKPLYYLDPQTGYFHRPDGVYEAVPDSIQLENCFWVDSMGYPYKPVMTPSGTLTWRKVEDK